MSDEALKAFTLTLADAAIDYLCEKDADEPQLVTAHIGDDLTLSIMICATPSEWRMAEALGDALLETARTAINTRKQ